MSPNIIIHKVGNKINSESLVLSTEAPDLNEELKEQLCEFFLNAFKTEIYYNFHSDTYLKENTVYQAVSTIFNDISTLQEQSEVIAEHLYDVADNPRIKGGELFICYFAEGEQEDGANRDKIGIFKLESKETFLKIFPENQSFEIEKDYGIALSKLDKGVLIYNQEAEKGFVVSVVDNNKSGDPHYWVDDFLQLKQREDDYFQTQETLSVYKDFIVKQLPQEFEVTKADQADFLNKSLNFFKDKEKFDLEDFSNQVLEDENVIESFNNYKTDYEQEMQVSIAEEFDINPSAVKKNQRHFKSVIKLDKNFHIYIHGDRKKIETGEDEKGKFYRLYFEEEK